MKTRTLYTCEICHTDYADKEKQNLGYLSKSALDSVIIGLNTNVNSIKTRIFLILVFFIFGTFLTY